MSTIAPCVNKKWSIHCSSCRLSDHQSNSPRSFAFLHRTAPWRSKLFVIMPPARERSSHRMLSSISSRPPGSIFFDIIFFGTRVRSITCGWYSLLIFLKSFHSLLIFLNSFPNCSDNFNWCLFKDDVSRSEGTRLRPITRCEYRWGVSRWRRTVSCIWSLECFCETPVKRKRRSPACDLLRCQKSKWCTLRRGWYSLQLRVLLKVTWAFLQVVQLRVLLVPRHIYIAKTARMARRNISQGAIVDDVCKWRLSQGAIVDDVCWRLKYSWFESADDAYNLCISYYFVIMKIQFHKVL